ncbi:DUF3482 domain-containing protein [Ramlibacter sp. AN1015]|uniref:DUF3482 domain-containing protein n=1 Tax=Ramlibacter sp. AN1015 TaxID=3133428 RepID=UPI0030BCDECA
MLPLEGRRARRLLLARAVEEADTTGKLISPVEREQAGRAALHAVAGPHSPHAPDAGRYLDERARRILEIVNNRDPRTAALQRSEPWERHLGWGLPLLALALGALLERIDNPGQVNMLSPPLLGFLLWNLLVYLGLLIAPLVRRHRPAGGPGGLASALRDWLGHRTAAPRARSNVRGAVAARFRQHWWDVAGPLEGWRIAQILHASAAAWAVGVGLSIVLGGLVREYRVGWESTLLDLSQVHALLSFLFAPVVALLPVDGFTIAELERMHFRSGAAVGQAEAREWITLYLGLLALVVFVPRTLLAVWAAVRRRWMARTLRVDLADSYYAELLARVSPARVVVAWAASGPRAHAIMARLWSEASAEPLDAGSRVTPLRTDEGDELSVWELVPVSVPQDAQDDDIDSGSGFEQLPLPDLDVPGPSAQTQAEGGTGTAARAPTGLPALAAQPARWLGRLRTWWEPRETPAATAPQRMEADLWVLALHTPEALRELLPRVRALSRPVLLLHAGDEDQEDALREAADLERLPFELLALRADAACWAWEPDLHDALRRHLPQHKAPGVHRLLATWQTRHEERMQQSMRLVAEPLLQAARDVQDIASGPLSLRRLVSAGEREASQHAREDAMHKLMERLATAQAQAWAEVRYLYGLPPMAVHQEEAQHPADRFVLRQSVDAPQAGMAGAASGAAAGAGIDLMTGGLTLGAAAALGALIGGGAGFLGAALKNRGAPGAGSQVQLSDEMLQALCEMAVLNYLGVALRDRDPQATDVPGAWRSEVVAVVEGRSQLLAGLWDKARQSPPDVALPGTLAGQLGEIVREVLARLRG